MRNVGHAIMQMGGTFDNATIIVRILTGLQLSFGFRLNISMNSISQISTICIQLITQYKHPAQRFLAKGMVYRLMHFVWRQPRLREMGHGGENSFSQGMAKLHQQAEGTECVRGFYSVFV